MKHKTKTKNEEDNKKKTSVARTYLVSREGNRVAAGGGHGKGDTRGNLSGQGETRRHAQCHKLRHLLAVRQERHGAATPKVRPELRDSSSKKEEEQNKRENNIYIYY